MQMVRKTVAIALVALAMTTGPVLADSHDAADTDDTQTQADAASTEKSNPLSANGYFRFDTDGYGTQFWAGATHTIGSYTLASDVFVVGSVAELDIGPVLTFGNLSLTPMFGIAFDFATTDVESLIVPQLISVFEQDKFYFESWIQVFFYSPFEDFAQDLFYTRNFLLYKVADDLSVGPQLEITYRINEELGLFERGLISLPIGARVNLGYGQSSTLGIFLGIETEAPDDADGVAGRVTFIHYW